jgi:hypothetical protein
MQNTPGAAPKPCAQERSPAGSKLAIPDNPDSRLKFRIPRRLMRLPDDRKAFGKDDRRVQVRSRLDAFEDTFVNFDLTEQPAAAE